jgi:hypothetical protein
MNYKKNFLAKIYITFFVCLFSASLNLHAGDFICDQPDCGREFSSNHGLIIHQNKKHKMCCICKKKFSDTTTLRQHRITCRNQFTIQKPNPKHKQPTLLVIKIEAHTDNPKFACLFPDCKKHFHSKKKLMRHIRRIHIRPCLSECEECLELCELEKKLEEHWLKEHQKDRLILESPITTPIDLGIIATISRTGLPHQRSCNLELYDDTLLPPKKRIRTK